MSSLIKESEHSSLRVESFEIEDICEDPDVFPLDETSGSIELPICGVAGGARQRPDALEKDQESDEDSEDFDTRMARLEREAYEKGFEQGQKDGLALEERQLEEKGKQLDALFAGIRDLRGQIYSETEGELLNLSLLIAKKIIRSEVRTDPEVIIRTIRSSLQFLVDKSRLRIMVNPEDMEEVKRILPDLAGMTKGGKFQVVEDIAIERGGCVLESGFGRVNATLDDQLGMLEKAIEEELRCSTVTHR